MKEIRVRNLPFGTLFKLAYAASMTSAILALVVVGIMRLFVVFPEPASASLVLWVMYLVVGPIFSALGFAICAWLSVMLLAKLGWIEFRIVVSSDAKA